MSNNSTELAEINDKLEQFKQLIEEDGGTGLKNAQTTDDPVSSIIVNMSMVQTSELKEPYIL